MLELAAEVQILQDTQEIATLNACVGTLRYLKKEADEPEFWLGKEKRTWIDEKTGELMEDRTAYIKTRNVIDKLSSLINLCIKKENRVLDFGNEDEDDLKEKEFEILNLSELEEQWDDEDLLVV